MAEPSADGPSEVESGDSSTLIGSPSGMTLMTDMSDGERIEVPCTGALPCCTCKTPVEKKDQLVVRAPCKRQSTYVIRCKKCHALKSRVNNLLKNRGRLASAWAEMSETERANFVANNHSAYGKDLEKKISESVLLTSSKSSEFSFTGTGNFMTEVQIDDVYKNQPEIAANIKKNARSFFDSVKGVTVYEDMHYSSKQEDKEKNEEQHRVRIDYQSAARFSSATGAAETGKEPPKKKKGRGQAKAEKPEVNQEVATPKVPAKDKAFAKKYIAALAPQKLDLTSLQTKTQGKEELFPAHVLTFATQTLRKIDNTYSLIEAVFNGEKCIADIADDRSKLEEEIKAVVAEGTCAIERLKVQVKEVENWCG